MDVQQAQKTDWRSVSVVSIGTAFAVAVHGYHPYAEDGGQYAAELIKVLRPSLFPQYSEFITEHLHFSLFAQVVTGLCRLSGIHLPYVLLILYVGAAWATLYATWMLAARLTRFASGAYGAVALMACWLTLPIAGTSLMLFEPYLTARSISTPLLLLATAFALEARNGGLRACLLSAITFLAALTIHPLMALYGLATILMLLVLSSRRPMVQRCGPWMLAIMALVGATILYVNAPSESSDYVLAELTRGYWFPFRWEWYEQLGLIGPLIVLALLQRRASRTGALLVRSAIVVALISIVIALVFCRVGAGSHLVARLQPLRTLHSVYAFMIIVLGIWLGESLLARHPRVYVALLLLLAVPMVYFERATYPSSARFELPWRAPVNPWVLSFLWARDHTPEDVVFALDDRYITRPGEDAEYFRAIAERSSLPDFSKDGGVAAMIVPKLAGEWVTGHTAQHGLNTESDAERSKALLPYGVSWVILDAAASTRWRCPYGNASVKVCQLPADARQLARPR